MILYNLTQAKEELDKGGIIGLPTETVYGLAGNIHNEQALKSIFTLKKRPFFNPLIVHIKSTEELDKIAKDIPVIARDLASKFWPGPLTLILPKQESISDLITANKSTVAIRVPNHPVALALLKMLDYPLAAPSANPFGSISPTKSEHVQDYFGEDLPIILEGGACTNGIESTIIGFENNQAVVYRLGAISIEELENEIGPVHINNHSEEKPNAPGMISKHYSPKTRIIISENISETIIQNKHKRLGIISHKQTIDHPSAVVNEKLSTTGNLKESAANLYAAMHKLDKLNLDLIIAEKFPDNSFGKSINDRLIRASKQ